MDPRTYLADRFRADHDALALRAAQLRAVNPKDAQRAAGPDASTSQQMADACDTVVQMLGDIRSDALPAVQIAALQLLIPRLEQLGNHPQLAGPVRSVYVGAATRIREIGAAESAAVLKATAASGVDHDSTSNSTGEDVLGDDDFDDEIDDGAHVDDEDEVDDDDLDHIGETGRSV